MKTFGLVAVVAAAAMTPAAAGAVTIANPSFEEFGAGGDPGAFFTTLSGSQLPGWTIENTIEHIGGYWQPQSGARSIDLSGNSPGAISQTLTGLTAGTAYIVSFFISGNPDGGPNPRTGTLQLGSSSDLVSYTLSATNTRAMMNWQQVSYGFTATGTTALLRLASSPDTGAFGLAVDNFAIAAVPEPASWAMMILGFGLAGAAIRRGKAMPALRLA